MSNQDEPMIYNWSTTASTGYYDPTPPRPRPNKLRFLMPDIRTESMPPLEDTKKDSEESEEKEFLFDPKELVI